jgi:hypothetical protein
MTTRYIDLIARIQPALVLSCQLVAFVNVIMFCDISIADEATPARASKTNESQVTDGLQGNLEKEPAFNIEKFVPITKLVDKYHMVIDLGALKPGVTGRV